MRPKKFYVYLNFLEGARPTIIVGSLEARRLKACAGFNTREQAETWAMWRQYEFDKQYEAQFTASGRTTG